MLHSGSTLEITSGLSILDQMNLEAKWAEREAALDIALRDEIPGVCEGTSFVALANAMTGGVPGIFACTVFCREQKAWTGYPYYEAGVRLQPVEPEGLARCAVFCLIDAQDMITPEKDVPDEQAKFIGEVVFTRMKWAALRGLWLSDDTTQLILPEIPSAPPAQAP
jgi:hypothetical protein